MNVLIYAPNWLCDGARGGMCVCVFVEMGIFVLMKNAESQLNK